MIACPVTLATPATAISLSTFVPGTTVAGQIRLALYNDNANYPGRLMAQTVPANVVAASWNRISLPYDLYLPAGTYWVVVMTSTAFTDAHAYLGLVGFRVMYTSGWTAFPETFPVSADAFSNQYLLTANVCP
jgi:hypothetical protein